MTNLREYEFIKKIDKLYEKTFYGTSKNYIWDEIAYVQLIINKQEIISNHMFKDVFVLAKYYRYVKKMDDKEIKRSIKDIIKFNTFPPNTWMVLNDKINNSILWSKKQNLKILNIVKVTDNEINEIKNMKDITTRKFAFVLLCMWKANGNKPFRTTKHQVAGEINLNANGDKLTSVYNNLVNEKIICRYNKKAERRKSILRKLIEVDEQYGKLFIPYDSFKYAEHISRPTKKSSIAVWRYRQDYYEVPTFRLPNYYENMTLEEKEEYKAFRYEVDEDDFYGDDELDKHLSNTNLEYIRNNIDYIAHCYMRDDFARIIGGEVFYQEDGANDKVKILFADSNCLDGILIDVNNLPAEYDKLFGKSKVVYGKCSECECKIVKKSNKAKYCDKCKIRVRKEKVKINMRNMREKRKVIT